MTLSPSEKAHQQRARERADLIVKNMGSVLAAGNRTDDDLARFVREATKGTNTRVTRATRPKSGR